MRRHRLGRVAAIAAAAALLAGCAGPGAPSPAASGPAQPTPLAELTPGAYPAAITGPSTAVLADESIVPVADDAQPALPTTVVSHDPGGDVDVTVTDASRVVALDVAGSVAATVAGLGFADRLVGRDVATTFPEAAALPVVTSPDGQSVDAEAVLGVSPTIVITDGSVGPRDVLQQLRSAGVAVVFVDNESSFAGAAQLAEQVAAVFGTPELGTRLADGISSRVAAVEAEIARFVPSDPGQRLRMAFLYLRGGSGVYYLFGTGSGADVLIDALGGIDAATEQGWVGMRPMTDEALVAMDPDLILVMTGGLRSVGGIDGLIASKPAVGLTTAGEHRRFVDMADGDILSFGPRSAEVLEALARAVYAP